MTDTYRSQFVGTTHNETYSSISYAKILATVLAAATSQAMVTHHPGDLAIRRQTQPDTYQTVVVQQGIGTLELFQAINSVYDQILSTHTELDSEMKDILYSNLWDLYE